MGELAETTSLLRMRSRKITESSNLSLSATSISSYISNHFKHIVVTLLSQESHICLFNYCTCAFIRAKQFMILRNLGGIFKLDLDYRLPQPFTKAS